MKEYAIKHNDYYILEEVNGFTRVESIKQASTFSSVEDANKMCLELEEYTIKRNALTIVEIETTVTTKELEFKHHNWTYKPFYTYNGIVSQDEEIIDEAIFNKLSEQCKMPSDEMVAEEWENVEVME